MNRFISILFVIFSVFAFGQSTSEKLKKEHSRLEGKIANTKSLLKKSQNNTATSLNELQVIENQINYRERLLVNFDNQIRSGELKIQNKSQQVEKLQTKIKLLKSQYKKLLLYAYKHRNKYGKLMYIFSAESYYEAVKRNLYLKKIAEIQKKQFILIKQHQKLISEEISSISDEQIYKRTIIDQKRSEKAAIQADKIKLAEVYTQFKHEEEKLLAELIKAEKNKAILQDRIAAAIQKEIAAAAAEAKRKAELAAKNTSTETTTTSTATNTFAETKESAALNKSFEGNRGKLPWPVTNGTVTEKFGKNAHPTLKNVYTNNRGIDISSPKNAQVRAVFTGEVTSVLNIPGAGKVVIIKHGNYRTVYSNLQETYVTKGMKVDTKKVIGSLLVKNGESISTVHFEIHKVVGSAVTCLNPSLWVAH